MKKVKIKLNTSLRGKKQGDIIELEADNKGTILDSYWRKRLQDAKIDNCIEIITKKGSKK